MATVIPIDIPDNTESLHNIGNFIMNYQPYQNAFVNALVNRIGRVLITSKMWNNPWSVFKKGRMEFGETVEEIFVNIAKPHSYDPATAEKKFMKRELPDVRAAFHSMNFQKFYKVTISNDQLRQAFLSYSGITDLIARIVDSLYTGMQYDEFVTMKYMLSREALNGGIYVETSPDPETDITGVVQGFRTNAELLGFLSDRYNRAGVMNSTPISDIYIIISAAMLAKIDVEVLAAAFNMSKADFMGRVITIDDFAYQDSARLAELFGDDENYEPFTPTQLQSLGKINAIMTDRDYWMVFDNFENFTQNYNGEGLYWQYWYHTWKTFSVSPFANAIVYTSEDSEITTVTVTPTQANVAQGSDLVLTATVAGSGLYGKTVTWSMESDDDLASGTTIDGFSGRLHIARDEEVGNTITVIATADNETTTGRATITVTAAQ